MSLRYAPCKFLTKNLNFLNQNNIKSILLLVFTRNGREVKRFCESVRLQNELKIVTEDFNKVSSDVTQVCNELSVDENKRRRQQIEENMNRKKEIVSSLIVNAIESIASKDKKNCSQFRPVSDETINRIGESYLNRLAPITLVVTKTEGAGDSAVKRVTKSDLEDKIDQIVS